MRGNHRKITVRLIEKEQLLNNRLAEYFANKYREERMKNV